MKQRFYVLMLFITGLSVTWCLSSKAHAGFEGIHKTICYHMRDGESMFQVSDKNTEEEKK